MFNNEHAPFDYSADDVIQQQEPLTPLPASDMPVSYWQEFAAYDVGGQTLAHWLHALRMVCSYVIIISYVHI